MLEESTAVNVTSLHIRLMPLDGMDNVTTVSFAPVESIIDKSVVDTPISVTGITTSTTTTSENMVNPTSTAKKESIPPAMETADNDVTAVNITGHLDSKVDIAHVWALWGVVIAAGLLVVVILIVLSFRCFTFLRRPKPHEGRKPGRRIPRFRRGTPIKLPARSDGVMADQKTVRKNFFHSLERGDVQARRQEATRRWLSGNRHLSTSLQYIDGSGSGGQQSNMEHECIPLYETSHRHTGLGRIPENKELQQEYAFIRSPREHGKTHVERPILHRHANESVNEFVRVIPLDVVRDQNANIALSPTDYHHEHHHYPRPRWNTARRPVTHSRVFPHAVRAVSSEPPRFPTSRRHRMDSRYHPQYRAHGRMQLEASHKSTRTKSKLPKFNLAGEAIITSSDPSANGGPKGVDFPSIWDDLSFDNTVFEPPATPAPRLVVPTNSPQTDDESSSHSPDSLNGVSAGLSQCNVSSDTSLTVTVGTSKRTSYEWDFYDPGYSNQPIRFVNGAYVPVIDCKQYWV